MIKLHAGNVLLKPSHRRQLMSWLRRALRLGDRIGDFVCTITLHRVGRLVEARATVHDRVGDFGIRLRHQNVVDAFRDLARTLFVRLHDQCLKTKLA